MIFLDYHGELTWTQTALDVFFSQLNMAMLGKQPQQCRSFPPFFSIFFGEFPTKSVLEALGDSQTEP